MTDKRSREQRLEDAKAYVAQIMRRGEFHWSSEPTVLDRWLAQREVEDGNDGGAVLGSAARAG